MQHPLKGYKILEFVLLPNYIIIENSIISISR